MPGLSDTCQAVSKVCPDWGPAMLRRWLGRLVELFDDVGSGLPRFPPEHVLTIFGDAPGSKIRRLGIGDHAAICKRRSCRRVGAGRALATRDELRTPPRKTLERSCACAVYLAEFGVLRRRYALRRQPVRTHGCKHGCKRRCKQGGWSAVGRRIAPANRKSLNHHRMDGGSQAFAPARETQHAATC